MTFHLRTAADLESLLARRGRTPRPDRLVLDAAGLAGAEARAWEARLSRYYFACGCEVGSVVLLLGLAGFLVFVAANPGGFGAATWGDAVRGAAVCLAAATAGKLAGLLHARVRLRATIRALAARVASEPRPGIDAPELPARDDPAPETPGPPGKGSPELPEPLGQPEPESPGRVPPRPEAPRDPNAPAV